MKHGFSLVELSIVLVILGLLVGGILAGQSLIRAAELRAVGTEFNRYATATHAFRDKYFGMPGDVTNATRFWATQTASAGCVSTSGAAVGAPGVCDGNGDGRIDIGPTASNATESAQYWRQLAVAGLLEGEYSGLSGSGSGQHCVPGTNCPRSRIANTGWSAYKSPVPTPGNGASFIMNYGANVYSFGGPATSGQTVNVVLSPQEAWNLDTKLDDGKPAQGKIIAIWWGICTLATTETDFAAEYKLDITRTDRCALYFKNPF